MMMMILIIIIIIIIIINVPKSVERSQGSKLTILRNQHVQTGRKIPSNKPDIIIRNNEKGTCMLVGFICKISFLNLKHC